MIKSIRSICGVILLLILCTNAATAADSTSAFDRCSQLLTAFHPEGAKAMDTVDHRMAAANETHTLMDLLDPNPATNLAANHPWLVMNAAQRTLSMILSHGVTEIADPNTGAGKVKIYRLLSGGIEAADGLRIIEQYRAIESLVAQIEALAKGDRAGLYPALLVGGPGTGKSELLKILRTALQNATLAEKESKTYSYEWTALEKIPGLRRFLPLEEGSSPRLPCPMHDSPVVLLPAALQTAVVSLSTPKVQGIIGLKPTPKREMCPHCAFLHTEVLKHYAAEKGHDLTPPEVVEALNKHIAIKRKVLGDPGTAPFIAVQGKDVDYAGLFVAKNPMVFADLGPGHPMSYFLNGKILGSNGNVLFLDEVGKNPPELQAKLLNTIQDRTVSEAGAPTIPLDAVVFMATNSADVVKIKDKDPQSPFLDRIEPAPMNWSIRPEGIVKTLGYEMAGLSMKKLGDPDAPVLPARKALDEFIPMPEPGKPVVTSDRRFNVTIEEGTSRVHVSPHALMYLATVASLTRMNFKADVIEKYGKFPIVANPVFLDAVSRVKAIMGRINMTQSQATELWTASALAGEGTFGMTAREASRWLNAAIKEARKADNGFCVTPVLLKDVLKRMVIDQKIGADPAQRLMMLKFAQLVAENFTVPAIRADIEQAVSGSQDGTVHQIYDEVIEEMLALHTDPQAKTYVPAGTNQPVAINRNRIEAISALYRKETGRPLAIDEIALFVLHQQRITAAKPKTAATDEAGAAAERHRDLIGAITTWQAAKIAGAHDATLKKVIRVASGRGTGNAEEIDLVKKFSDSLEHQLGYCKHCAARSLELLAEQPDHVEPAPKE